MTTINLTNLAEAIGAQLRGDGSIEVSEFANLGKANEQQLSFLSNSKYASELVTTKAAAVILSEDDAKDFSGNALIVDNPYLAFAKAAQILDSTPPAAYGIAESAIIDSSAELGDNVSVGAGAVVSAGAKIGNNVIIGANCFVGEHAVLANDVHLRANVSVYHRVELGERVSVHSGTVIGSDGFGYANDKGRWVKIPQTGTVIVGADTEIGANCAIDRGALDNTIIGENCVIDNLVHIAHNVEIGDFSCICGGTGIAGSAVIGKYVVMGGMVAVNGHITIADKVQITGNTMVNKSITEEGVFSSGVPVAPNLDWRRNMIHVKQLDKLVKRVKALEKAVKD